MEIRVGRGVQVALTHLSSQKPRRPQACKWFPCWANQVHHCPLCPGLQEASPARPGPRPTLAPPLPSTKCHARGLSSARRSTDPIEGESGEKT